jgi:hypothetical protein
MNYFHFLSAFLQHVARLTAVAVVVTLSMKCFAAARAQ